MTPAQIDTLAAVTRLMVDQGLTPADLYGYHLTLEWKAELASEDAPQQGFTEWCQEYWYDCASHDFIDQALATAKELT